MQNGLHVLVVDEGAVVNLPEVLVAAPIAALIEHAQNLLEPVVHLAAQTWYLYDDAVVRQTVDKSVGQATGHQVLVVVVGLVLYVDDRLLDVAHLVTQNIDGNHRHGVPLAAVGQDVLLALVLHAKVLPETQRLRLQPRLLNLYQYQVLVAPTLANGGCKVYAKHRERVALAVGVLVGANLHFDDVLLQQCRQDSACHTLVLHQKLEHAVVNGIGYCYHTLTIWLQKYE